MYNIKDMVSEGKVARFVYYRDEALHYETEDGFLFPIPVHETGSATYNKEEKAMLLLRYIRKHVAYLQNLKGSETTDGH